LSVAKRKKTGGRKAGTPNKTTGQLKEMILRALSDVGGQKYLSKCAEENPVAFLALLGKVLPMQVAGSGDKELLVRFVD